MENYIASLEKEFSLIENGFKEEEKRALADYKSNDKEYAKNLAFLAYKSDTYQVRMYGVFLFGYLSEQDDILAFMRDEVSKDYIEHETEILKVQAMNENPDKPENIIEKMIVGRLNKELKEVCLLDQAYVKAEDGKQAVGKYVEQVAKANGANVTIKGFVRFETGEGIEKKEEDFAAEVAAQLK